MEMLRGVGMSCYSCRLEISAWETERKTKERDGENRDSVRRHRSQRETHYESLWSCYTVKYYYLQSCNKTSARKHKHMVPRIRQTDRHWQVGPQNNAYPSHIFFLPPTTTSPPSAPAPPPPPPVAPPFREAVFKQRNALCFFSGVCMSPHAHPRVLTTSRLVFNPN